MSAAGMRAANPGSEAPSPNGPDRTQAVRVLGLAVTFGLCAWLAYCLWGLIGRVLAYYVPLPTGDYWRVAQFLRDYQAGHLKVLWMPHNEHRIIFPEIVYATDMILFRGREVFSLVVSFGCYTAAWVTLARTVFVDKSITAGQRVDTLLLSAGIAFWPGVSLALADPFLLQWTLMHLAVALSLVFLFRRNLALTIVAGVVATYSSGNGLMLFPLLIGLAFLLPVSKRFIAALAVAGALSIGLYFFGYHTASHADWALIYKRPFYLVGFLASYVAMPFSGIKAPAFGVAIGLISFAFVGFLLSLVWRKRLFQFAPGFVLSGYYLFTLLTALITAVGRVDLGDKNFGAAKVIRYLTVPCLNWGALLLLALWISARLNWRLGSTKKLALALGALLILGTFKLRFWERENADVFASFQVGMMSLDAGLLDGQLIHRVFPSPEFVRLFLPELKKQRLGIFHYEHEKRLGVPLRAYGPILNENAQGRIISASPVEHGVEIIGWINPYDSKDPTPRILLANENNQVVGFGRRPTAGFPLDLLALPVPENEAWIAFANLAFPSQKLTAYALTKHGVIPIDGSADVPTFTGASQYEAGGPLPDISWSTSSKFGLMGLPASPSFGWRPTQAVYSSWQGGDANTGQITGTFAAPANHCVILPILHGPSIGGASAQLLDADSGKILVDLPFKEKDYFLWSLWRIPLSPDVKRLKYVVTDAGNGWGQWLAVSTPMHCD